MAVARHRGLRRLQGSWTACIVAEMALATALAVVAFDSGGAAAVGMVGLVRSLPPGLLGPALAAATAHQPSGRVLKVVLLVRTVLVLSLAGLASGSLGVLLGVAAVDALAYSLFWPAHSTYVVDVAEHAEQVTAANSVTTTAENLGGLLGPGMAAVALAVAGPRPALLGAAALLGLAWLASPGAAGQAPAGGSPGDLLGGFSYLIHHSGPRLVILVYLLQTLCLGGLTALLVVASFEVLGWGGGGAGVLAGVMGAGGVAGSLASLALVGRVALGRTLSTWLVFWGVGAVLAGLTGAAPVVAAGLLVVGAGNAFVDVAALTLLQRTVAPDHVVKVLGVFEGLWWAALGVGAVGATQLSTRTGAGAALVTVGVILALGGSVARPALGRLRLEDSGAAEKAAALRADALLGSLPAPVLEALASQADPITLSPGERLFSVGDAGDSYYVLVSGEVSVSPTDGPTRTLGPGEGFGEIALLQDRPRTATVVAGTTVALLSVGREDFLRAVRTRSRAETTAH
jgi:hypothetical protein